MKDIRTMIKDMESMDDSKYSFKRIPADPGEERRLGKTLDLCVCFRKLADEKRSRKKVAFPSSGDSL